MLNRPLYLMLRKNFGPVKISNEGIVRVEERVSGSSHPVVHVAGEHYGVNCPLCGDERGRLSISYRWLMPVPMSGRRTVHLAHCYNEECNVTHSDFWMPLLSDLEAAQLGLLGDISPGAANVTVPRVNRAVRLPLHTIPVHQLPEDHEAVVFLRNKYNIPVKYLGQAYGAAWSPGGDEIYAQASRRIVFPIYQDGALYSWQGRAVDTQTVPRWYLPPGFVKCLYNSDAVAPHMVPVLTEGIPGAVASGPHGVAIFGKQINTIRAREIGERWKSVVVALDPDTFVPDNRKGGGGRVFALEMAAALKPFVTSVRLICWPAHVLELATRHNNGEDVMVPDAADLGLSEMKRLIDAVV